MDILFLTKSKVYTCKALKYLAEHHNVVGVVCKEKKILCGTMMDDLCKEYGIKIFENDDVYHMIAKGEMPHVDLAISNTYGRLIKSELIEWTYGNCINFHCAILPKYKGLFTYNHGLLNEEKEWGVTVHYVNEKFDEGEIIRIERFPIDAKKISVRQLEMKAQKVAYEMTIKIVDEWERKGRLPSCPQTGEGRYYSIEDFERAKKINVTDKASDVERKIHAFWCPPYEGAYIQIDGKHFQLLPTKDENIASVGKDREKCVWGGRTSR